mmetsp:Transcript_43013/g.77276  ORF Transcript_43013/g.77276 Transcript_43013/m.77276 type:complete len:219 (+) Transcript_43013:2204-2860(+)
MHPGLQPLLCVLRAPTLRLRLLVRLAGPGCRLRPDPFARKPLRHMPGPSLPQVVVNYVQDPQPLARPAFPLRLRGTDWCGPHSHGMAVTEDSGAALLPCQERAWLVAVADHAWQHEVSSPKQVCRHRRGAVEGLAEVRDLPQRVDRRVQVAKLAHAVEEEGVPSYGIVDQMGVNLVEHHLLLGASWEQLCQERIIPKGRKLVLRGLLKRLDILPLEGL